MMKIKFLLGCILLLGSLSLSLRAQDTAFWFVASEKIPGTAGKASSFRPAFGDRFCKQVRSQYNTSRFLPCAPAHGYKHDCLIADREFVGEHWLGDLPWSLSLLPGLTKWVFMSTQISKISRLKNTAEDRTPYSNTG